VADETGDPGGTLSVTAEPLQVQWARVAVVDGNALRLALMTHKGVITLRFTPESLKSTRDCLDKIIAAVATPRTGPPPKQ
jgi:hypothetical protein